MSATQLGALVVKTAVERAGLAPEQIDEVILGNVVSAGLGQNPARQAALGGGLLPDVAAMTINKVCGSGLKAVGLAAQGIQTGDSEIVVAGGMESMSNAPYLLPGAREGYRLGPNTIVDSMIHDGLWDAYENFHMANTGEIVAERYHVSRERQDEYALNSHRKAVAAIRAGRFRDEIVAVPIPQRKGDPVLFETDEAPRPDATIDALRALKPAFKKDGTVTAGNAPGVNDGAAAVVVTSAERAAALGKKPIARIVGQADDSRDWFFAQRGCAFCRRHDHGRRAIVDAWCIAGRDSPVFFECRLQCAQCVDGSVRPRSLICFEEYRVTLALGDGHRNDLIAEPARANGSDSLAMAVQRVFILTFAAHMIAFGNDFTCVSHVEVFIRIPETVMNHGVDDRVVTEAITLAGAGQQVGRICHALHAAGNDNFRVAGLNTLRRKPDGLQSGAANLVYGHRGNIRQKTAAESGLPGRILAQSRRDNVAQDDFVNLLWCQAGALNSRFHNKCAKLRRAHRFQSALKFSDGCTDSANDDGVFHAKTSNFNIA